MFGGIRKRCGVDQWYFVKNCRSYFGSENSFSLLKKASTVKEDYYNCNFLINDRFIRSHEQAKIIVPPEFV
jgi:hypothetical protein